ncbi:alpha/beta hydrolase [Chelatococcus sp. SYSU_G07232]|uniref:Alpha/beta hydrolase n=1 Tax=Chelatococcus albus TaxID=3047466 RepID=A0ABT7AJ91_9HYPH|nr:alpha/beta hydrolase [Chelatococcus sp. SYSU_G07232]MDJ1159428.1 alpha/beta hydrolase [Chelatococcus sp. SYSU_G07232]
MALIAGLAALALAGCAGGPPETGALVPLSAAAPTNAGRPVPILVATTRQETAAADKPGEMFSGERAQKLGFAAVTVAIPPTHKPGKIEWPQVAPGDPARNFVTLERNYLTEGGFKAALHRSASSRAVGARDVLLFIHGYNNRFDEAVYRYAQIVHDSGFAGTPVLFTWASRGSLLGYGYDEDSATAARDRLEETLRILAADPAVARINVLAHSMGNWVTLEALRQAKIAGHPTFNGKLGDVIMAAPDVDVDVFKSQMRRLGKPAKPFYLMISKDDRALAMSSRLRAGKTRLGEYDDSATLSELGIIAFDLTKVDSSDPTGHGKFAQAPQIVQLIGARLNAGDQLNDKGPTLGDRLITLGSSFGGTVMNAADLVISAPGDVLGGVGGALK